MRTHTLCGVALSVALAACVDNSPPVEEPRVGDDIAAIDPLALDVLEERAPAPQWVALMPGSPCAEHADCDSVEAAADGFCYRGDMGGGLVFPDEGYCAIDDGTGEVCDLDEDCPGEAHCISAEGYRLCLPSCGPGDTCPAGQACLSTFGGLMLSAAVCVPGNVTAADGDTCGGFYDCNADSECFDDLEHPGGYCSAYACTLGTDAGCNGGTCIDYQDGVASGTVCVDACSTDDDCRLLEGYVCHDPDGDGGVAPYCRHPHVGDACGDTTDCAGWTCQTGAAWPDGYCTVTGCPTPGSADGCSGGAVCADVGGSNQCVDRCPTIDDPSTCRSGYTCQAVGVTIGGGCLAP